MKANDVAALTPAAWLNARSGRFEYVAVIGAPTYDSNVTPPPESSYSAWDPAYMQVCNKYLGKRRAGVSCREGRLLPAFALPGDECLIADTVSAGERHGGQAAAVVGVKQFLALGWREAQPAVAAGADDGGVGGGGFR